MTLSTPSGIDDPCFTRAERLAFLAKNPLSTESEKRKLVLSKFKQVSRIWIACCVGMCEEDFCLLAKCVTRMDQIIFELRSEANFYKFYISTSEFDFLIETFQEINKMVPKSTTLLPIDTTNPFLEFIIDASTINGWKSTAQREYQSPW